MRSTAIFAALVAFATPLAAQGNFRTGGIDPTRQPSATMPSGGVIGDILGARRDSVQRRKSDHVPPGQRPPAGMCRIWIDGVPPGQQPAPTDCQTAVANKPSNARILWGDQSAFPGKGKGKFRQGKTRQDRVERHGRDDADDDNFDKNRRATRGKASELRADAKLVAKRGKKG